LGGTILFSGPWKKIWRDDLQSVKASVPNRGRAAVLHGLHYDNALGRGTQGYVPSQHADIVTVVQVGVAEKDGGDIEGGKAADGEIGGDEGRAIDIEPGQEIKVHQVVYAAGVPVLEELLIEEALLAEILAEIQEYAFSLFFQVDLVAAYAVGPVVDRERSDFSLPAVRIRQCQPIIYAAYERAASDR
jgi:hypothetical protein